MLRLAVDLSGSLVRPRPLTPEHRAHILAGMSTREASTLDDWLTFSDASARHGISPQTLGYLCESGRLRAERQGANWRLQGRYIDKYLRGRRQRSPRVRLSLQGTAPLGFRRYGVGWLFHAKFPYEVNIPIQVWFSDELVSLLRREQRNVDDVVVRAVEHFVADSLLYRDQLTTGQELQYQAPDLTFVLHAAGHGHSEALGSSPRGG
ncbi:helix-turn-helix domain-containing protein [Candidatus Aeolococcus gillhamiae]|uniref:helix-turn-helix domain-containing protein n=1 Tax=Candidatus Aeolococcus gillhamiae TaxID=3127015 RepID=UPI003312F9DF